MAKASWHLTAGDTLAEELTVVQLLGGGTALEAYLCFDEETYGPVVVKVLRPDHLDEPSARANLAREVAALEFLRHPVLVRILRAELAGDRPHVVLENIDGPRLSTLIRRQGALPPMQYLPMGVDLASALHYLSRRDHVHLDLKPGNVIMGAPARLIDLSVARSRVEAAKTVRVGTDAYLSPEQADPATCGQPDVMSDVWGWGVTMFQAISGQRAFDRGDPQSRDLVVRFPQLVAAPNRLAPNVDKLVRQVVYAALEKRPQNRPLPAELAEAIEQVLTKEPRMPSGAALTAN